jgi:hypothetical protein
VKRTCRIGRFGPARQLAARRLRGRQRLIEVGDDVVDVLNADRQPDIAVGDAGLRLLRRARSAATSCGWD